MITISIRSYEHLPRVLQCPPSHDVPSTCNTGLSQNDPFSVFHLNHHLVTQDLVSSMDRIWSDCQATENDKVSVQLAVVTALQKPEGAALTPLCKGTQRPPRPASQPPPAAQAQGSKSRRALCCGQEPFSVLA